MERTLTLTLDEKIERKMRSANVGSATIQTFLESVRKVRAGDNGMMPESGIIPIPELKSLETVGLTAASPSLLKKLAVIKLNGGLGTGMGLDGPKSLLRCKGPDAFLDFIARQILALRAQTGGAEPAFFLMNSFSTQHDTLAHLQNYPSLTAHGPVDFLQNKVPKLEATTLEPVDWPSDSELEWCPPGHGDLYPTLLENGLLEMLLDRGIHFAFVSNSDNLGATVDLPLLGYFAESGLSFLMEAAERTPSDNKGGHLAIRGSDGRFILRESAQCPKENETQFQDIQKHRFFNTNNLWIRLDHLRQELRRRSGVFPLPIIKNVKTVDPRDPASPKVLQLESAMGAAIESFAHSGAIVVPRSRFSPVKTTSDLLALRSDAYEVTSDHRLVLIPSRQGTPPFVDLDPAYYKMLGDFEKLFPAGAPSLADCASLIVRGKVQFASNVTCRGNVRIMSSRPGGATLPSGIYDNVTVSLDSSNLEILCG